MFHLESKTLSNFEFILRIKFEVLKENVVVLTLSVQIKILK